MAKQKHSGTSPQRVITPQLVREALAFIPPDVDRDTWARVGMAIKSEFSGEDGFTLWNDWSALGESYDERNARDTWRSIKAGGRTTIATLFGIAKDHGFTFRDDDVQSPAPTPEQAAQAKRIAEAKRQEREAEDALLRERASAAERRARTMWDEAAETGVSPYLTRKGVAAHGVRYLIDGTLLVPMRDEHGELRNLQRISPNKPPDGSSDKRFMPGSTVPGLWHQIGLATESPVLLLGEGYATCASLHEATGLPIAVAFSAGNLVHVAKALRRLHPDVTLIVCADDDRGTEARTGRNTGKAKAIAAALAAYTDRAKAGVVFPDNLPEGGVDFNDQAAHAGLESVRAVVLNAVQAPVIPKASRATKPDATDKAAAPRARRGAGKVADDDARPPHDRFVCDDSGVWYRPPAAEDGTTGSARRVCDRLEALALARDVNDRGGALLLEFDSVFGKNRRWLMPLSMLAGDGAEYRRDLLDMGFMTPHDSNRRRMLTDYLQSRRPTDRVRLVDRVGWHGRSYVLPRETLRSSGEDAGEPMMFHADAVLENTFDRRGTLQQWQERIGQFCVGNSRLTFAVCAALAGPLLAWVPGMESGGFHLCGRSSGGKTTALRVAASVWGGRNYLQRWRATDNGLEGQAAQHSDALLVLDELGQLDPKVAGEAAYMLANGSGKIRGARSGGNRPVLTWRLLWLSAGEIPLSEHMAEAGKRIRAGQELRMVDMPADAEAGLGLFDTCHQFDGGGALSQHLTKASESTFGVIGRLWLEWLVDHSETWKGPLRLHVEEIATQLLEAPADGQVERAARRFALVAAAGELATAQGLTGWSAGEATTAACACFKAWVKARPAGWGSSERDRAIRQVRAWLEKNGDALFTHWHRAMDDHRPNTAMRAGFKRVIDAKGVPLRFDSASDYVDARAPDGQKTMNDGDAFEFYVFPEQFRQEICKGLDYRFVAKVLKDGDFLACDPGRDMVKRKVPGYGNTWMYLIKPSIFSGDEER